MSDDDFIAIKDESDRHAVLIFLKEGKELSAAYRGPVKQDFTRDPE